MQDKDDLFRPTLKKVNIDREVCLRKKRPWLYQKNYHDWRDSFEGDKKEEYARETGVDIALAKLNMAPPDKILICAPSNAAIDEIIRKI